MNILRRSLIQNGPEYCQDPKQQTVRLIQSFGKRIEHDLSSFTITVCGSSLNLSLSRINTAFLHFYFFWSRNLSTTVHNFRIGYIFKLDLHCLRFMGEKNQRAIGRSFLKMVGVPGMGLQLPGWHILCLDWKS